MAPNAKKIAAAAATNASEATEDVGETAAEAAFLGNAIRHPRRRRRRQEFLSVDKKAFLPDTLREREKEKERENKERSWLPSMVSHFFFSLSSLSSPPSNEWLGLLFITVSLSLFPPRDLRLFFRRRPPPTTARERTFFLLLLLLLLRLFLLFQQEQRILCSRWREGEGTFPSNFALPISWRLMCFTCFPSLFPMTDF
jgi:hypothetical protein